MAHAQKPDFVFSAKRKSPFKSAGASVRSTTGSRGVRISGSNAGYTVFRGSVKGTGYPLHSPVSPSLPLSCVTVCFHVSTGLRRSRSPPVTVSVFVETYCYVGPWEPQSSPLAPTDVVAVVAGSVLCVCQGGVLRCHWS